MIRRAASRALIATAALSAIFMVVAGSDLDRQGAYYDELHQAAASFSWTGSKPELFCYAEVDGWCFLNMSYSAAIKTNLYGAYLRLTGAGFDLEDWRLLGIIFIPIGLMTFAALASATLTPAAIVIVGALSTLDVSLALMSRFDWGPVALGTALRFAMLGAWLSSSALGGGNGWSRFVVGMLASVAATEKLSASVLIPVAIVLCLDTPPGTRRRAMGMTAVGLGMGLVPLAGLNLYWLLTRGHVASLANVARWHIPSWGELVVFLREYTRLGQGGHARGFTLGVTSDETLAVLETGLIVVASVLIARTALARRSQLDESFRRATVCLMAYWLIGIELFLIPNETHPHHWIIGTPFQYVAIALWTEGYLARAVPTARGAVGRRAALAVAVAVAVAVAWLAVRLPAVVDTRAGLRSGVSAPLFDRSFTALGRFAATKAGAAVFVAEDWGVATQIACFSDGRAIVHELFWHYRDADQIEEIWRASGKRELFLVRRGLDEAIAPDVTRRIERDVMRDRRWTLTEASSDLPASEHVRLLGFVRNE